MNTSHADAWNCPLDKNGRFSKELLAIQQLVAEEPDEMKSAVDEYCRKNHRLSEKYQQLLIHAANQVQLIEEEENYYIALAEEHAAMQYGIEAMTSDMYDAEVAASEFGFNCY